MSFEHHEATIVYLAQASWLELGLRARGLTTRSLMNSDSYMYLSNDVVHALMYTWS